MLIYNYDRTTKEYITTSNATPNPLEAGFLIPANATTIMPPVVNQNEIAIFDEITNSWVLTPDYRGETWFNPDGTAVEMKNLGDKPTSSMLSTRPIIFTEQIQTKIDEINAERENRISTGVVFNGNTFQSDAASINNIMGTISFINSGGTLPTGFTWRDANNNDIIISSTDLISLGTTLFNHVNSIYKESFTLKDAAKVATTQAELDAIVWS